MILLILFFIFPCASAVIYQLNETEYVRMPPLFHLDPYELCVHQTGGIYCMAEIDLVSDSDSNLLNMIHEYSARKETHFNHSRLHYGICLTKMCNDNLKLNETNTKDLNLVVEKCFNTSFWKQYRLKTRINEDVICHDRDQKYQIQPGDVAVAAMCFCFVLLSFTGSAYDLLIVKNNDAGNKWLLCFSIKRNWFQLRKMSGDNRIKRLKGLNGMKVITTALVITIHSLLPFGTALDNTQFFETTYSKILYHLLMDGTVMVQTYFVISGCLLSYCLQMLSEDKKINWKIIPRGILLRWLRLTPPYAVVLAITTTWLRFAGSGPLWQKMIGQEVADCRRYGWQNMLYINNYFDDTRCMAHTWYVAADMQLYVLGTFALVLVRSDLTRQVVLSVVFVVTLFIAPLHTYYQNLYAHVIITPEVAREYFVKDPTFNHSYKRGHTNLTCYILGLSLGLLIYKLQQKQLDIERYKKFKYLFWATFPMIITTILCTSLFYMDGVTPPLIARTIYAGTYRTVIGLLLYIFILGMVFKLENFYRPILEWRGWTSTVRVCYSAYILHLMLIQIVTYSRTTLNHLTIPQVIMICLGSIAVSFLAAVPLWLLIESPITQIVKVLTSSGNKEMKSVPEIRKNKSEFKSQL